MIFVDTDAISIHVPAWGTTRIITIFVIIVLFQSTFPRGERPGQSKTRNLCINFNPRSRVGNDKGKIVERGNTQISIHVPAWGTTTIPGINTKVDRFQSTFPRGERPISPWIHNRTGNFNPRSRVGNDVDRNIFYKDYTISIHVPAWGTTGVCRFWRSNQQFQSTFPRGERRMLLWDYSGIPYFNPRSRVGNDVRLYSVSNVSRISIHVPAWGTTTF